MVPAPQELIFLYRWSCIYDLGDPCPPAPLARAGQSPGAKSITLDGTQPNTTRHLEGDKTGQEPGRAGEACARARPNRGKVVGEEDGDGDEEEDERRQGGSAEWQSSGRHPLGDGYYSNHSSSDMSILSVTDGDAAVSE